MKNKTLKTHVAIVLDRSGSMGGTEKETVQCYNEQVQQQKLNSKDGQEIFCSLVTFNGNCYEHLWNVPAEELTLATVESYSPGGNTAMRDAVGYTVKKLLETTDSSDPDTAYLVIIISDGEENASKHFNISAIKELVESCQKTNRWTFTYLGCSQEYLQDVAKATSIPLGNMASWSNTSSLKATRGLTAMNASIGTYYTARVAGATNTCGAFSGDAAVAADFSSDNSLDASVGCSGATATVTTNASPNVIITNVFGTGDAALVKDWIHYTGSK